MKLIIMSSALLRDMLILCTPLELAACFHLVEAYMHRDLYTYHCESDHCRVSAVSAPSAQKIATIALALLILRLSIIDWHVPRCFRSHQLLCRILTAMSMQALRVELACTVIAFLLPTFGKRSQDQGSTSRKRSTPTRPATEQTPEIPADAEATMQDPGNASILRCSDSAVEPDAATEHIAPASFGSAGEASSGCGDMTIKSLDDVVSKLSSDGDESAAALRNAVQTLQRGVQAEIRNLCKPWGVQLTAKNDNGKYSKRADAVLKSELKDKFIAKAKEHFRAKANENQPLQHAVTEHTPAIQLKKGTEAPASSAATEHAETEFHIDEALAETLRSLQALGTQRPIWTRVIDHACSSEHCMSYRLVAMLRLAHWNISADLCNDQPLDACGYIAADAVCRLRDAALSEANSWHDIPLPDYAQVECISRGNKVLRKKGDQRILETDEVNCLVRHYSHLDQRRQAAEEWWAGAVALDHFLTGLPIVVEETVSYTHLTLPTKA